MKWLDIFQIFFIMKAVGVDVLTTESSHMMHYGTLTEDKIHSLLRLMTNVYGPNFFHNPVWTSCILWININFLD